MANIPVISPIGGQTTVVNNRYNQLYNNPHFDYLSEMLPRDIKDMFRWCELVYHSMPTIANGIRKLVNYPVTDFSYGDAPENRRRQTKELLSSIHMKSSLLDFGTDSYVYGNVFRTVYFPFQRFLVCKRCKRMVAIEHAKFKVRGKNIILYCSCGHNDRADISDQDTNDISKVRIVRWDPKRIELRQNPITGKTLYFYEMPADVITAIKTGDVNVLADTPRVFIDAALEGKEVRMGGNFFHAKNTSLSGFSSGWGISPLMSTLKQYMYIAVLRRASEAIGMEHITPKQILFPQSAGGSDPSIASSLERWNSEISEAIRRWRYDPNYTMLAPYPTGFTNIGSQGRALTPTEEIKDARNEMAMALDIPIALIMGDATIQNSSVGLRILENQLTPHIEQLEEFTNWVISAVNQRFDRNYCPVELVPFRLADDIMNKQLLVQMQGQAVSRATLQEAMNIDPDKERARMKEEQLADHDMQAAIQKEIDKRETDIASLAQAQEQSAYGDGMPTQYDQQKMMAQAQEIAMQMVQMPFEERASQMRQLQSEDYVMWALVSKQVETMHEQMKQNQGPQGVM